MNIQIVVERTGLTKRMIRHYEEIGLLEPSRSESNYRQYSENHVHRLLCVKALRQIGFGLEDISAILKEENTEEVLRRHLQELLFSQQEKYLEQRGYVETIKELLSSKGNLIHGLLDRIAGAHAPSHFSEKSMDDFFKRNQVVHGYVKDLEDFAQQASFGEFRNIKIEYTQFKDAIKVTDLATASICSCEQLYTHLVLMTPSGDKFDLDFHRSVWPQFAKAWMQVSHVFSITFEAITKDMSTLAELFSPFDLAAVVTAEDPAGEKIRIIIPGQPLLVYLKTKNGLL